MQVDFGAHEALHVLAGQGGDFFEHGAPLTDDNALVAGLFAINGGVHFDDLVPLPLGKADQLHGGAVGDLLIQAEEQLFPQNLGADLALGLVGDHVLREELGAFGQEIGQQLQQFLHAFVVFGGDGQDGVEAVGLGVGVHDGQQGFLFHGVDLVDDQHRGDVQAFDACDELRFRTADVGDGFHQQQHRVHVGHALLDHVDHVVAQLGAGLVEAGSVHEDELAVVPVDHGADTVAGGLGLVGHDGDFLAHQRVGQGGLAHIGPAHNRDHAGFFDFHRLSSTFLSNFG